MPGCPGDRPPWSPLAARTHAPHPSLGPGDGEGGWTGVTGGRMDVEEGRTEVIACHRVRLITLPAWVLFFSTAQEADQGKNNNKKPTIHSFFERKWGRVAKRGQFEMVTLCWPVVSSLTPLWLYFWYFIQWDSSSMAMMNLCFPLYSLPECCSFWRCY